MIGPRPPAFLPTGPPMPEWFAEARCRGIDLDLFFDPKYEDAAKELCGICPMRERCLRYALKNRLDYGVWGGTTSAERLVLLGRSTKRGVY